MFYHCYFIYNFIHLFSFLLNSAVIATILSVLLAGYLAKNTYQKQKMVDRFWRDKENLVNEILYLQEKIHYTIFLIDRIANSYQITNNKDIFLEALIKHEIPRLSDEINENIPASRLKIINKVNVLFSNNDKLDKQLNTVLTQLSSWHDPIVKMQRDFKNRTDENEQNNLKKIDEEIKKLILIIWKEKVNEYYEC